jgi:hypothetical protein
MAVCLHVCARAERTTWSRGAGYRDGLLALSIAILFVILTASTQLASASPLEGTPIRSTAVGFAHLAALAFVARRTPGSAPARTVTYLFLATALPALIPPLRPLLDASPAFHAELFARPAGTWAPILTLVLTGLALPSLPSLAGTSSP